MLSWSCRRFRARFSPSGPGSAHPHRRVCPDCDAYAAALESAAGVRLPLPASLRRNLRSIADPAPRAVLPFAVPRLPVPDALAVRLRGLSVGGRSAEPSGAPRVGAQPALCRRRERSAGAAARAVPLQRRPPGRAGPGRRRGRSEPAPATDRRERKAKARKAALDRYHGLRRRPPVGRGLAGTPRPWARRLLRKTVRSRSRTLHQPGLRGQTG